MQAFELCIGSTATEAQGTAFEICVTDKEILGFHPPPHLLLHCSTLSSPPWKKYGSGGLRKMLICITSSSSFCANCVWSKSTPGLKPPPVNQEQKGPAAIPQGGEHPAALIYGLSWTPTHNDRFGMGASFPGSPVAVPQLTAIPPQLRGTRSSSSQR